MASRFFATENRSLAAAYQSKGVSVISGTASFFTFGAAGVLATGFDFCEEVILAGVLGATAFTSACGTTFAFPAACSKAGFLEDAAVAFAGDFGADAAIGWAAPFAEVLAGALVEALDAAMLKDFLDAEIDFESRDLA